MNYRTTLFAVLLVAALLRMGGVAQQKGNDPFFRHPLVDAYEYDRWGREISEGHWHRETVPIHGPLYPYILGLIYRLSNGSYAAPRYVQAVVGVLFCLFLFLLGRRLFGVATGLAAAGLGAIYAPSLVFGGQLLVAGWAAFASLALLLALDRFRTHPSIYGALAAGGILGITALFRTHVLVFIPAALIWMSIYSRKGLAEKTLGLSAFVCGVVLPLLPVAIHNAGIDGSLVPVQAGAGFNFYIGNREGALGVHDIRRGPEYERLERWPREAEGISDAGGRQRFYLRAAVSDMGKAPLSWVALCFKKLRVLISGYESGAGQDVELLRSFSGIYRLPWPGFSIVLALALSILFRRNGTASGSSLLWLFAGCYGLGILAFFVSGRYRLPLAGPLILLASYGAILIARDIRKKKWRAVSLPLGAALIVWVASATLIPADCRFPPAQNEFQLGFVRMKEGDFAGGERFFRKALARDSAYPMARYHLALALEYSEGSRYGPGFRGQEAEGEYRAAMASAPDYIQAMENLVSLLIRRGEKTEVEELLRRCRLLRPERALPRVLAAQRLERQAVPGSMGRARREMEVAAVLEPSERVLFELSRMRWKDNDPIGAAEACQRILQKNPSHGGAREFLRRIGVPVDKRRGPNGQSDDPEGMLN